MYCVFCRMGEYLHNPVEIIGEGPWHRRCHERAQAAYERATGEPEVSAEALGLPPVAKLTAEADAAHERLAADQVDAEKPIRDARRALNMLREAVCAAQAAEQALALAVE